MAEPRPLARGKGWRHTSTVRTPEGDVDFWQRGKLRVGVQVADMELPGGGTGPTWLLSVAHGRRRATNMEAHRALKAFGMIAAEEDNHHPGVTRSFFLPVDPARRGICECKTEETVHREPDGYVFSTTLGEEGLRRQREDIRRLWGRR